MQRGGKRENAGRPNELGQSKQFGFRVPMEIWKKLEERANNHKTTVADIIRDILKNEFSK